MKHKAETKVVSAEYVFGERKMLLCEKEFCMVK